MNFEYESQLISAYVLSYYKDKGVKINNFKLQRVLYYVQGYSLKFFSTKAFKQPIYRWKYGTVVPEEYYRYCCFIREPISYIFTEFEMIHPILIKIINKVCDKCEEINEYKLSKMVNEEQPCKKSIVYEVISEENIYEYFKNHNPLKI